MKFPFDFSIALIFRLVFPGLVLALAFTPLFAYALHAEKLTVSLSALIPAEAVLFGWCIVLLDQPIYMLYEGRRYWPDILWRGLLGRQAALLSRLTKDSAALEALIDKQKAGGVAEKDAIGAVERKKEIDLKKLDFPLGMDGEPMAIYPTALGNLLTAYETYPKSRYGMDAIFYWYRLWVVLDKDLRETMDQAQSIADSAIYVSFALLCSALVFLAYAIGYAAAPHFCIEPLDLPYLPPPWGSVLIAAGLFAATYVTYRLGLHAQRQYGEMFRSLFDQYRDKLDFAKDAAALAVQSGAGLPEAIERPHLVASRFLRYHMIRPAGEKKNCTPESFQARSGGKP